MATTGDLTRFLAEAWGLPESAIAYPMRALREDKIIPKGKRGKGGIRADAGIAADIIIVGSTAVRTFDVVDLWKTYAHLKSKSSRRSMPSTAELESGTDTDGRWHLDGLRLSKLQDLPAHHTFRDALVALIETTAGGDMDRARDNESVWYTFDIRISGPSAAASIDVRVVGYVGHDDMRFLHNETLTYFDENTPKGGTDLTIERKFTHETIRGIAALLKGQGREAEAH